MESFFNSLKNKRTHAQRYATREEAREDTFKVYRDILQSDSPPLKRLAMSVRHSTTPLGKASGSWLHKCCRLVSEKQGQTHTILLGLARLKFRFAPNSGRDAMSD